MEGTLPKAVICDDCGAEARVRSYGRVEYDWPKTSADGQVATIPTIRAARLTIDCPNCGVKSQDIRLTHSGSAKTTPHSSAIPSIVKLPARRPFSARLHKPK
jgi:hypothetical protein